jgi:hypothetical protein
MIFLFFFFFFFFFYSGWDVQNMFVQYNFERDELHIALDCFAICGDADGDGDASRSSLFVEARGGQDLPNLQSSESIVVALDVGVGGALDGAFDFVLGVPAQRPARSDPFPCNATLLDTSCFNLYLHDGVETADPYNRALWSTANGVLPHPVTNHNPATSAARPDIEWTILSFNQLLRKAGAPQIDATGVRPFSIQLRAFAGSFQDDGIGEDNLPNAGNFVRVNWLCQTTDACGVCGGNNSTCRDCAGVPNGSSRYDACDVCGGNGSTCRDCAGVPNGAAVYDRCDVCAGDSTSCRDCAGTPGGSLKYDKCGVCGGDGFSCFVREECSETFQECGFTAGQIWDGTFNRTARLQPVSGGPFRLSIGSDAYAAFTATGNRNNATGVPLATFLRFVIIDAGLLGLQQVDSTGVPQTLEEQRTLLRFGCTARPAKYKVTFGAECRALRLVPEYDECAVRRELLFDVLLTLRPCTALPARRDISANPIIPDANSLTWAEGGRGRPVKYGIPYAECAPQPGAVFALRYTTLADQADEAAAEFARRGDASSSSSEESSSDSHHHHVEPVEVDELGLLVIGADGSYFETSRHGAFMGVSKYITTEPSNAAEGEFAFDVCELAQQLRADTSVPACNRTQHATPVLKFDHSGWCRRAQVSFAQDACPSRFDRLQQAHFERLDVCGNAEPFEAEHIEHHHLAHVPEALRRHEHHHDDDDDDNTEFEHLYKWPKYIKAPAPTPYRVSSSEQERREHEFRHNRPTPKPGRDKWGLKKSERRSEHHYHSDHILPAELQRRLRWHLPRKDESSSDYWAPRWSSSSSDQY